MVSSSAEFRDTAATKGQDDFLDGGVSNDNNEDDDVVDTNNNNSWKNSFSLIQSRKFLAMDFTNKKHGASNNNNNNHNSSDGPSSPAYSIRSSCVAKFCPSMDLILVESNQPSSLVIYRTISWQKVATIPIQTMINPTMTTDTTTTTTTGGVDDPDVATTMTTPHRPLERNSGAETSTMMTQQPTPCYCWSPNGQSVAVAQSRQVSLYGVESLANPSMDGGGGGSSSYGGTVDGSAGGSDNDDNSMFSFPTRSGYPVLALHWAHVGRNHPTAWNSVSGQEDDTFREISWRYQSYYVDRSTRFLPPSAYNNRITGSGNGDMLERNLGSGGGGGVGTLLDDLPSESQQQHHDDVNTLSNTVPECKTPLSVLCVSTERSFELYLHGRYPLLTLPRRRRRQRSSTGLPLHPGGRPPSAGMEDQSLEMDGKVQHLPSTPPLVVASNDLAYWLMMSTTSSSNDYVDHGTVPTLSLYHMPFLSKDRYAWQQIAALHTSIMSHTTTLRQSVSVVANNWKNSLRPLDLKLQPLVGLLKNYGVDVVVPGTTGTNRSTSGIQQQLRPTLQTVVKEYIMMGHTSHSTSIANAMDQFFTNIQMNDQLLQRMERSLYASMANVESAAIEGIVRPTQALGWQIQELAGLVLSFDNANRLDENDDDDELLDGKDDDEHIPSKTKKQLLHEAILASEQLWISAEHLLTYIVMSRLLVRDLCGWLRHAGSQVKARGTAVNSVQRNNAKKRRVAQDVLERLVSVLGVQVDVVGRTSNQQQHQSPQIGLTESLLSLKVTEMLKSSSDQGPNKDAVVGSPGPRPPSPSSVASTLLHPIPKVQPSLERTIEATISLFQNPLSNVPSQIRHQDFFLPLHSGASIVATHSRIGRDFDTRRSVWDSDEEDDQKTCFLPKIADGINPADLPISSLDKCRQWFLIAQAYGNIVQLFCLPLGWRQNVLGEDYFDEDDDDNNDRNFNFSFYLTTKLVFPQEGSVRDVGFYGDDGKSSLSSGQDSGTGMEGRQKIGVIYHSSSSVELWMTSYDSCVWQAMPFDSVLVNPALIDTCCTLNIVRTPRTGSADHGYDAVDDVMVSYAETRRIPANFEAPNASILLCGSRGMGAVAIASDERIISLEVLDLEDDEQDDDGDELMEEEADDDEDLDDSGESDIS